MAAPKIKLQKVLKHLNVDLGKQQQRKHSFAADGGSTKKLNF